MAHILGVEHKAVATWRPLAVQTQLAGAGAVFFLTLTHLVSDAIAGMFSALLPTLQAKFELGGSMLAVLVALTAMSSAFLQPVFGALADRVGRRQVAAWGIIANAIFFSLVGVVSTPLLLLGVILLGGLGAAAFHPASSSLARAAGGTRRQLAVGLYGAGGLVGVSLGPVLVLMLMASYGVSASGWLMVPGVLLGLLMFKLIPASTSALPQARPAARLDLRLLTTKVGGLVVTAVLANLAGMTFSSAVPLWLVVEHGYARDASLLGWTLTAYSLAGALGGVVAAGLSSVVAPRRLAAGSLLLAAVPFLMLFTLEPGSLSFFIAVVLAGALSHAGAPLVVVAAQDRLPSAVATASGLLMGFAGGVAGLIYIGIGRLQETLGLEPAMQIGFLMVIPAALIIGWLMPGRTQA